MKRRPEQSRHRRCPHGGPAGRAALGGVALAVGLVSAPAAAADLAPPPLSMPPVAMETPATLQRPADRVLVFGEEVPAITGVVPERYAVLAFRDDDFEPVPFQIDERNPYGYLILDHGPHRSEDIDDGRFDGNDELVFMAADAGDRAPAGTFAGRPGVDEWAEVELEDPGDGTKAWAYVVRYEEGHAAPRSPVDYARYDPARDRVVTSHYDISFPADDDGFRRGYPDVLRLSPDIGGDGSDLIDRLKLRMEAEILFGLLSFSRHEDDFRTRILAWSDGPIRVVRRVETALHIMFGIYAPPVAVDNIYFRDSIENPNIVDSPVNVGSFLSEMGFRAGFDLSHEAHGMRFVSPDNPDLPPFDGVQSEAEANLVAENQPWHLVTGEQGTFMTRFIMGPTLPLTDVIYYLDDHDADDGPEDEEGSHEFSRDMLGGLAIKKGRHNFNAFLYAIPHWKPGDEEAYLALLDRPLTVTLGGPGTTREQARAEGPTGDAEWKRLLDRMEKAAAAIDAYEAELHVYSSAYRGRLLEGWRTYEGRAHREPRWVFWEISESEANYDDPITDGIETAYYADEDLVIARGSGVRRVFGTVEMKTEDAATWWWGETVTNQDYWSLVDGWRSFTDPGYGWVGSRTVDGRTFTVLNLVSTAPRDARDLRDPLGTGAANVEITRIRVLVDPDSNLPVRVESFIAGNPKPVAWLEFTEVDTDVELERSDFDLSLF